MWLEQVGFVLPSPLASRIRGLAIMGDSTNQGASAEAPCSRPTVWTPTQADIRDMYQRNTAFAEGMADALWTHWDDNSSEGIADALWTHEIDNTSESTQQHDTRQSGTTQDAQDNEDNEIKNTSESNGSTISNPYLMTDEEYAIFVSSHTTAHRRILSHTTAFAEGKTSSDAIPLGMTSTLQPLDTPLHQALRPTSADDDPLRNQEGCVTIASEIQQQSAKSESYYPQSRAEPSTAPFPKASQLML